jgi:hypothetical protein
MHANNHYTHLSRFLFNHFEPAPRFDRRQLDDGRLIGWLDHFVGHTRTVGHVAHFQWVVRDLITLATLL